MHNLIQVLYAHLRRVAFKHLLVDIALILASLYAAFLLRMGSFDLSSFSSILWFHAPAILIIRVVFMIGFGCYAVMWRYISTVDAWRLVSAVAASSAIILSLTFLMPSDWGQLPRTVYLIDAILVSSLLMGARLYRRLLYESRASRGTLAGRKTLIYGAGQNGRSLAHRFKSDAALDTNVVGFIEDDPKKADLIINGIPVLGNKEVLAHVIEKFRITQLVIAMSNISGDMLREIVMATRPYNIKPLITPRLSADRGAKNRVDIYREIELSDLLNRPPRQIDLQPVRSMVQGKCVLVTGAGGSIGSELARQIMSHEPDRVLLLDHSEYNLYEIDKELRLSSHDTLRVVPLMIDLKDEKSLTTALREYAPTIVFHAAAYKHVHLVESNPYPSILNNIEGTRNLLEACKNVGVETFVMISTDKAVNPAGVMGATKRVCELLVTKMAIETGQRYCSVRFGNVLGSSGSLIPLLTRQIQTGGPITITHPDMTRFFMLIPEAVSLVLKAATIANPGDINILKMGDPVKILDVARSLLALMGRTEKEIPIVFTGLRPGEKMFEELYIRGDELSTEHPDILTLSNGDSNMANDKLEVLAVVQSVEKMISASKQGSKEALFALNELVKSNYVPAADEAKDGGNLTFLPRIH